MNNNVGIDPTISGVASECVCGVVMAVLGSVVLPTLCKVHCAIIDKF